MSNHNTDYEDYQAPILVPYQRFLFALDVLDFVCYSRETSRKGGAYSFRKARVNRVIEQAIGVEYRKTLESLRVESGGARNYINTMVIFLNANTHLCDTYINARPCVFYLSMRQFVPCNWPEDSAEKIDYLTKALNAFFRGFTTGDISETKLKEP